jgi:nitrite reductase (NADH) small subunit
VAWHTLEPASRIRVGQVLSFRVAGRLLAVGRSAAGYFALDAVCPHAGGDLGEGEVEGECVICPLHGFAYDVRSGEGLDDGGRVRVHATRLRGDMLEIELPEEHNS